MPQDLPNHDDVKKWKYFPRYWPFVRGIHRSLVNKSKSKKSKKTLFNVRQFKQYNISSHSKWVLVADKSMHMAIYNEIHIKIIP